MTTPARRAERVVLWLGGGLSLAAAFSMRVALSGDCSAGCMPPMHAYPLLAAGLIMILIAGEAMTKRRGDGAGAILHRWFPDETEAEAAWRAENEMLDRDDESRLADAWARLEESRLSERLEEE